MSRAHSRVRVIALLLVLAAGAVVVRLWDLQVAAGDHWRAARAANPRGHEWLAARRGEVLDRHGRVLAADEAHFVLQLGYRGFRRGHAVALLVHLDRYLRDLRRELGESRAPPVRGAPLGFAVSRSRLAAALDAVLAMPARWLHKRGPLGRRLRGVLRFYVFSCLASVPQGTRRRLATMERTAAAFDALGDEPPAGDVCDALAERLTGAGGPQGRSQVRARARAWLERAHDDLQELAALLGDRLVLRGIQRETEHGAVAVHGDLLAWLDAMNAYLDRRVERAIAERSERSRKEAEERATAGIWERIKDAFLTTRLVSVANPGFEEQLDHRFRLENASFEVAKDVPFDTVVALVLGRRERFPGFRIGERLRRVFPRKAATGSAYRQIGLVRARPATSEPELPPAVLVPAGDELDAPVDARERINFGDAEWQWWKQKLARARKAKLLSQRVGLNGVEAALDDELSGFLGLREILRTRPGKELASPRHVPAGRGHDVALTVDADLQDLMVAALKSSGAQLAADLRAREPPVEIDALRASFALIDARSGDVLGMAWLPETQVLPSTGEEVPFRRNTVARHWYQPYPGSVIKPLVAYEGLARGLAEEAFELCRGSFRVGPDRLGCDCRLRGVPQTVEGALEYSCNSWFAQLGARLGVPAVYAALDRFELGPGTEPEPTFGLRVDAPEVVAGEQWSVMHRAVGYGYRVAPLRVARAYAGIGTGSLPVLRYVRSVGGEELQVARGKDLRLAPEHIGRVRDGLRRVPLADGTARNAGLGGFALAGKTGTAEVKWQKANNAWFAGYLPHDAPRLAFCCVYWAVPVKVHGGDAAAVAVAELLRAMRADPDLWRRYVLGRVR